MAKCFRSDGLNQALLLPPPLQDWLPEKHLARFVADVVETLNLSAFYRSHKEKDGRGQAAYNPVMMVRLRLYGFASGYRVRGRSSATAMRTWPSRTCPPMSIPAMAA